MSPEQARGQELDARSDLFFFGAVLFEMATGSVPFPGETAGVIFAALLGDKPVDLSGRNAGLPAELDRIIRKALEKDRDVRYQTASDMLADLKRLKRDTESATRPGPSQGGRALGAPRWRWSIAAAVLLLGGVAVSVAHSTGPSRTPFPRPSIFIYSDHQLYRLGGSAGSLARWQDAGIHP